MSWFRTVGNVVVAAGLLRASCAFADLQICADGKSDYVIVAEGRSKATFAELRGAREVQSYIEQMSGVRLPVVSCSGQVPEHAIIVGRNAYTDALGVELDPSLADDGFVVKTVGQRLVLAGPGKRGSLYACYDLLEKLGVRWFTATATRVPRQGSISVPDLDERQAPAFEYREPMFSESMEPDFCAHLRCNSSWAPLDAGYGGHIKYSPHFVHTMWRIVPESLYDTHPEYFPLVDGKRLKGGRNVQRCLSNPELLKLTIDTVNRWIDEDSEGAIVSVSQNDVANYCTCDDCKKLMEKYGGPSGEYIWFVNKVAEAVEKKHPKVLIDTLAYQFTEAPPKNIKPRDNVRVRLCPIHACEAHPYEQCTAEPTRQFVENLKAWSSLTDNLYIWHYCIDFHHELMPFPDFNQFPDSIRMYKRFGVKGVFLEGDNDPDGGASDAELRSYVMAKLLWNPELDSSKLVDEWMTGVYGTEGARPMRKWFDLLHEQVKDPAAHLFVYDPPKPQIFSEAVLAKGQALLAEAEKLVAADPVATQYVKKAQLDLRYVKLAQHPANGPELQQFLQDLKLFGITHPREQWTTDRWLKDYLKQASTAAPAKQ